MNWSTFLCFLWLVAMSNAAPPEILSDIKVHPITDTTAEVNWDRPGGSFVRYSISISPSDGVHLLPLVVNSDQTPRILLSNLTPSTDYTTTIWTVDSTGSEGRAKAVSFTTRPPRVVSINVSQITTTGAKLSWERPNGLFDHYKVTCQECIATPSTVPAKESNPQAILSFETPGHYYSLGVYTVLETTSSPWFIEGFHARPAPVEPKSISVSRISTISATVKWGQVTTGEFRSYLIRFSQGIKWSTRYIDRSTRPLEVALTELVPATKYNVTIQTESSGERSDEASIYFTTARPDINITSIFSTNATATWTKSPGTFDYYNITITTKLQKVTAENMTITLPSTNSSPEVKLLGLVPGNTYRVHVWTVNGSTKGLVRSSEWFKTKLPVVKEWSIQVERVTAHSATLTWGAVTDGDIDYYSIMIRHALGGTASNATVEPSKVNQVSAYVGRTVALRGLTPGTEYTVIIKTNYGQLESDPVEFNFTTGLMPVDTSSIFLTDIDGNSAKVTWDSVVGNFDQYIISIRPTSGGARVEPDKVAKGSGILTTDLKSLTQGSFYIVTIRTVKGTKKSATAHQVFQTLPDPNHTRGPPASTTGSNNPTTTSKATTPGFSSPPTSVPTFPAPTSQPLSLTPDFPLAMILTVIALSVAVICAIGFVAMGFIIANMRKNHSGATGGKHGIPSGHMANPTYLYDPSDDIAID